MQGYGVKLEKRGDKAFRVTSGLQQSIFKDPKFPLRLVGVFKTIKFKY